MPSDKARDELVELSVELLAPAGAVRARRMFGGHGLYVDDLFVAIIAMGRLYLKADDTTRAQFEGAGCEPFEYSAKDRSVTLGYWSAPYEALESQFYEAQPQCWGGGIPVPAGKAERRKWLEQRWGGPPSDAVRQVLAKWYGAGRAQTIRHAEALELCEYGRRPSEAELKQLFPFFE